MSSDIEIGYKRISRKGFEYEVIEYMGKGKYKVRFTKTGYETISDKKEVKNGGIRDWEAPYVCGMGVVGKEIEHPQTHYLYDRWRDMLRRCYDKNCNSYNTYGRYGVTVDERWFRFINYVNDIESKPNSDKLKIKNGGWDIDKDTLICGNKVYSNETTQIIPSVENVKERNSRKGNPAYLNKKKVMQFSQDGEYIKTYNSLIEAYKEVGNNSSNSSWIIECCKKEGVGKTAFGYCWMYEDDFIDFETSKKHIINKLSQKPILKRKGVIQIDNFGNAVKEYGSVNEVAEELSVAYSTVCNSITRKCKCKGLKFAYKTEEN